MYDAGDISTNIFNVPVFTSLFNELTYVFVCINTDNLKEIRIIVLEVIFVTGIRLV